MAKTDIEIDLKDKELKNAFIKRINDICEEKNITLYELSVRSGVHKQTLYSIMRAERKSVTLYIIMGLCHGMGIKLSEFFDSPLFDDIEWEK